MRAVHLRRIGSPLEDVELPDQRPGDGEIEVAIRAAGICHSDVHYCDEEGRARLPLVPGHEIAGDVTAMGPGVTSVQPGDRVALHYLLPSGDMLGKEREGGYAESIIVPAGNAVAVPSGIPFSHAAIMMCSTATAWHALKIAGLQRGESVAILGFGGLGISALQLARLLGARSIAAVDVQEEKLHMAESFGARPVDGRRSALTESLQGIDVVLDFATHGPTTLAALRALAPRGRLVFVGINLRSLEIDPFRDILAPERTITGSSDHTRDELVELMELARSGAIDLGRAITRTVPLSAAAINSVFDDLRRGTAHFRTVIEP